MATPDRTGSSGATAVGATGTTGTTGTTGATGTAGLTGRPTRLSTETKASPKTTELYAFLAAVAGILISAALIKGGDSGGTDEFIARQAWLYVAIVTAAYLVSRGLAKSGSRDPYWADSGQNRARD